MGPLQDHNAQTNSLSTRVCALADQPPHQSTTCHTKQTNTRMLPEPRPAPPTCSVLPPPTTPELPPSYTPRAPPSPPSPPTHLCIMEGHAQCLTNEVDRMGQGRTPPSPPSPPTHLYFMEGHALCLLNEVDLVNLGRHLHRGHPKCPVGHAIVVRVAQCQVHHQGIHPLSLATVGNTWVRHGGQGHLGEAWGSGAPG